MMLLHVLMKMNKLDLPGGLVIGYTDVVVVIVTNTSVVTDSPE